MPPTRARPCRSFGAKAVLKRLAPFRRELARSGEGNDTERLHRLRVASRRLTTALDLFQDGFSRKRVKAWTREIRRARRALGAARDADVQIAFLAEFLAAQEAPRLRPGVRRLMLRLRQRRNRLQGKVLKALNRLRDRATLEDLREAAKRLQARAAARGEPSAEPAALTAVRAIEQRLGALLDLEPCVHQADAIEQHHAMRIAVKRLRYAMEVFEPLYGKGLRAPLRTARRLQQLLGAVHDCDVWVATLPDFVREEQERTIEYFGHARPTKRLVPGLDHLREDRSRERARLFGKFAAAWDRLREQRLWENLVETLHAAAEAQAAGAPSPPCPVESAPCPTPAPSEPPS